MSRALAGNDVRLTLLGARPAVVAAVVLTVTMGPGEKRLRKGRTFVASRKGFQPSPRHGPIFLAFRHVHAVVLGR